MEIHGDRSELEILDSLGGKWVTLKRWRGEQRERRVGLEGCELSNIDLMSDTTQREGKYRPGENFQNVSRKIHAASQASPPGFMDESAPPPRSPLAHGWRIKIKSNTLPCRSY